MTRSVEIPEEAVEAALDVVMDDGHNGIQCKPDRNLAVTMRASLTAALPYLAPAEVVIDHRPGETCSVAAEVDPETGFARAPDGDVGLRFKLGQLVAKWRYDDSDLKPWQEGGGPAPDDAAYDDVANQLALLLDELPPPVPQPMPSREQVAEVLWKYRQKAFPQAVDWEEVQSVSRTAMLERADAVLGLFGGILAPAVPQPVDREALLDRGAVENAIATKAMYYDSGTAVHELDDGDLAGLVAATDAIMQLVRPVPTLGEVKAAIRTGLGGDTEEEACGCESHICSAADAVLAVLAGEQEQVER